MTIEFISPVGRLVQGGISLNDKMDDEGKPVIDLTTGLPIKECFIALAVEKTNPEVGAFYAQLVASAREAYPTLIDANGNCSNPKFSWKIQDGDGVDKSGKSVADKPGFAGHWIFKMGTRYLPRAFHHLKYDPSQQIQNPSEVIKRGDYIRVSGTARGNGVAIGEIKKIPGIFVSPDLIELMGKGIEITSGPDAAKVLGGVAVGYRPAAMSAIPVVASGGPALPGTGLIAPPLPTGAPPPIAPPLPTGAPPPIAAPAPLPLPVPAGPQYAMTPSAQGGTRESLIALGWTDDGLIAAGHMVRVA